jgi:hypothetical protein
LITAVQQNMAELGHAPMDEWFSFRRSRLTVETSDIAAGRDFLGESKRATVLRS